MKTVMSEQQPHGLLDEVISLMGLKNDAALSRIQWGRA